MGFIFIHPYSYIKVKVSVLQSYATLSNPMNCSPPGSSVHEILQTRILEWIAISSSRGSSQTMDQTWVSWIAGRFFTILAISHISISISVSIMEIHYEELAHTVMEDKKCCDLLFVSWEPENWWWNSSLSLNSEGSQWFEFQSKVWRKLMSQFNDASRKRTHFPFFHFLFYSVPLWIE